MNSNSIASLTIYNIIHCSLELFFIVLVTSVVAVYCIKLKFWWPSHQSVGLNPISQARFILPANAMRLRCEFDVTTQLLRIIRLEYVTSTFVSHSHWEEV